MESASGEEIHEGMKNDSLTVSQFVGTYINRLFDVHYYGPGPSAMAFTGKDGAVLERSEGSGKEKIALYFRGDEPISFNFLADQPVNMEVDQDRKVYSITEAGGYAWVFTLLD